MKTIGLIAGMSWESSLEYYRILNETVADRLGGFHSAKCILYSVDFDEVELLQRQNRWDDATDLMIECARRLERAGADFIVICTNTMHKMADEVGRESGLPVLHIADTAAAAVIETELQTVGLLGTRFTMEEDFYTGRLTRQFGLRVLLPTDADREIVHRVIYDELVKGEIRPQSRAEYVRIMEEMVQRGAQGIVLACTEIGLLVKERDSPVPLFDTTAIHARAAAEHAMAD